MRIAKYLISGILLLSIAAGCRKEKSSETGGIPDEVVASQWEFTASDSLFQGSMDSALLAESDSGAIVSMAGPALTGNGEITLQIFNTAGIQPGEYQNKDVLFQYAESGIILLENSLQPADHFTITITKLDSVNITGTFSGTVQDGLGGTHEITGGKFTAPIRGGGVINPPTDVRGTLTVWSKALCDGGGAIKLIIADQAGQVLQANATEPVCGAAGTSSYNLTAGVYTVSAICQDTSIYEVTVDPNSCTLLEVTFQDPEDLPGDYFPLANKWTYNDASSPSDTLSIQNVEETQTNGQTYTAFLNNSSQETRYYRKDGPKYYEYVSKLSGLTLEQPLEFLFLQDDVPAGSNWETSEQRVSNGSLTVTGKLKFTIERRDFKRMINGKMYYDLIEVRTDLLIKTAPGVFSPSDSQTVIYAKGIGVVYYQDRSQMTDFNIRYYDVIP